MRLEDKRQRVIQRVKNKREKQRNMWLEDMRQRESQRVKHENEEQRYMQLVKTEGKNE